MAFPTTYAGWIAYIRDWLSADEYSEAQIASFLDLAQLRLNRELESYYMEGVAPITTIDVNPIDILTHVPDFNKVRLVSLPNVGPLDVMAVNEIKLLLATKPNGCYPRGYCIDAGLLYMYPVVAIDTVIDFLYYKKIPSMVGGSTPVNSNVFSINHQDALLYASLLAGSPYMRDNEDVQIWESQYALALMAGNQNSNHIKMGSSPLVRDVRIANG